MADPKPLSTPPPAPRPDLFATPHRTLRYMLSNLLVALGRTSFGDRQEVEAILRELEAVLAACDGHVLHEDTHLRPALLERAPSMVNALDAEHAEHADQTKELRALAASIRAADAADEREELGRTLYLHYSVFVAETLAHAAYEERVVQPMLLRLFSTEELQAIHRAILASIAPREMMVWLRAMIPSSSREARAALAMQMRANAPPEAFRALMNDVRTLLAPQDVVDLEERLAPL